ncbi:MAG TPA: DUF998 domain-containing protein [Streptosporangiaceae bacterium]|nr:DUF998 domain-containing protein [Streptosporangiaceae bacterium]
MTTQGWIRVRLVGVAASSAAFALAVIVLGTITPGYSQWSDAVSRLGSPGERFALAARSVFAAYGVVIVAGASPLRQYAGRQGRWLTSCLVIYGAGCVIAGVAPKDQPGAPHTAISEVHVIAAILAGGLAIGAMTLVSRFGPARADRRAAAVMALLTGIAAIIFWRTWGTTDYGVAERVLLGLGMTWISAVAIRTLIVTPGWTHGAVTESFSPADDRASARRASVDSQPVGAGRGWADVGSAELAGPSRR